MKFKRIIFWIVVLYASVIALGTMGVDVTAIVASLGLVGFALGFALRDIVSNLVAGIVIKATKQYEVGDTIKVVGFQGAIESINLRYTLLIDENGGHYIPNKLLFANPVTVIKTNDDD